MWQLRDLLIEARRNLSPWHLTIGLLCTLLLTAGATLITEQATRSLAQQAELQSSGLLVWSAVAAEGTTLDGLTCDRLRRSVGVDASGGVIAAATPAVTTVPNGDPLDAVYATPGAAHVFDASIPSGASTLGEELAAITGSAVGSHLLVGGRPLRVDAIPSTATALSQMRSGILIAASADSPLRQCWVRMAPGAGGAGGDVLRFAFAGSAIAVEQHFLPGDSILDPQEQWDALAEVHPGLAVGLASGGLFAMALWSRRTEIAIYRTFGTSWSSLVAILLVETIVTVTAAACLAAILTCTLTSVLSGAPASWTAITVGWRVIGAAALAAVAVAGTAAFLLTRGSIAVHLKDRS